MIGSINYTTNLSAGTKKLGKAYYGNQKGPNRVDVMWYEFDRKEGHSDYQAYASYTNTTQQNQCIPVTVVQYGTSKGGSCTDLFSFLSVVVYNSLLSADSILGVKVSFTSSLSVYAKVLAHNLNDIKN